MGWLVWGLVVLKVGIIMGEWVFFVGIYWEWVRVCEVGVSRCRAEDGTELCLIPCIPQFQSNSFCYCCCCSERVTFNRS